MTSPILRMALLLGRLSAIGPFAIEMYLPALPAIGRSLGGRSGRGSDEPHGLLRVVWPRAALLRSGLRHGGRKPLLYAGLALFARGRVGCALGVWRLTWLTLGRRRPACVGAECTP